MVTKLFHNVMSCDCCISEMIYDVLIMAYKFRDEISLGMVECRVPYLISTNLMFYNCLCGKYSVNMCLGVQCARTWKLGVLVQYKCVCVYIGVCESKEPFFPSHPHTNTPRLSLFSGSLTLSLKISPPNSKPMKINLHSTSYSRS